MTVRERTSHDGALFQSYEWRDYPLRSGEDDIKGSTWAKSLQKWLASDHDQVFEIHFPHSGIVWKIMESEEVYQHVC